MFLSIFILWNTVECCEYKTHSVSSMHVKIIKWGSTFKCWNYEIVYLIELFYKINYMIFYHLYFCNIFEFAIGFKEYNIHVYDANLWNGECL